MPPLSHPSAAFACRLAAAALSVPFSTTRVIAPVGHCRAQVLQPLPRSGTQTGTSPCRAIVSAALRQMSAQIAQPMHSPTSRRQRIAAPALNLSRGLEGLEERRMSHDQYRRKETIQMVSALQVRCPDIECEGCANAIKRSLGSVAGVRDIQVGVESKSVTVQFDPARVSEGALRERLSRAGFRPA